MTDSLYILATKPGGLPRLPPSTDVKYARFGRNVRRIDSFIDRLALPRFTN